MSRRSPRYVARRVCVTRFGLVKTNQRFDENRPIVAKNQLAEDLAADENANSPGLRRLGGDLEKNWFSVLLFGG